MTELDQEEAKQAFWRICEAVGLTPNKVDWLQVADEIEALMKYFHGEDFVRPPHTNAETHKRIIDRLSSDRLSSDEERLKKSRTRD